MKNSVSKIVYRFELIILFILSINLIGCGNSGSNNNPQNSTTNEGDTEYNVEVNAYRTNARLAEDSLVNPSMIHYTNSYPPSLQSLDTAPNYEVVEWENKITDAQYSRMREILTHQYPGCFNKIPMKWKEIYTDPNLPNLFGSQHAGVDIGGCPAGYDVFSGSCQ